MLEDLRELFARDVVLDVRDGKVRVVENKNPEGMQYQDVYVRVLHFSTAEKPWRADTYTLREGMQELWQPYFEDDCSPGAPGLFSHSLARRNMKSKDGIVTLSDEKFFPGALALIKSIRCNSPTPTTVLDTGLTPSQVEQLRALGAEVFKPQRTVDVDVSSRFGCCYAFFDIAQSPYENILYIDADCLVLQDLSSVFKKVRQHGVVAVSGGPARLLINGKGKPRLGRGLPRDAAGEIEPLFRGIPHSHIVLNTGVVGIKRSLMERVVKEAPRYSAYFQRFAYPDQDLFNIILADLKIGWHDLGYLYNATSLNNDSQKTIHDKQRAMFKQLEDNLDLEVSEYGIRIAKNRNRRGAKVSGKEVAIVHYTSSEKPWLKPDVLRPGMYELWRRYHDRPETSGSLPRFLPLRVRLRRRISRVLRVLGAR